MENIERINLKKVDWRSSREFFESLGEALDKLDEKDESYNFTWVGKRKSIIEAGAPINKTLRPDIDASKDFDSTKNMLIVGDNLDALKLLQESYLGKIKMIYIDPPYNTGHDFVYHDNFTVKKSDYEDNTTDSEGNKIISEDEFTENSKSNGRFHSDWLSMMYPRLKLARNLLTDDGVIFISIDDNEQSNLKNICDEVFGEDNFITNFIWKSKSGGANDSGLIATDHEYILLYRKGLSNCIGLDKNAMPTTSYNYKDEHGEYSLERLDKQNLTYSKSLDYDLVGPDNKVYRLEHKNPKSPNAIWRWSKERVEKDIDKLVFKDGHVYTKNYKATGAKPRSLLIDDRFGRTRSGSTETSSILDGNHFNNPKSLRLIKHLTSIGAHEQTTILDFFAGSGTTGHAVMDLNAEDGGNRKYILVQLDEPTDEKSEARKAGYKTIDQITAERLHRAGDKILKEHPDLEGKLDTGFRVFRVDSANEREDIRKSVYDTKQEDMFDSIDNIKHDRTPLDLLFGTIIYMALPLDLKLEVRHIGDNTVYFYGYLDEGMGMIACFDDNISDDTVKEIAKLKPLTAVFKDSSFKDSAAKINLSEIFRTISNETRVKVI